MVASDPSLVATLKAKAMLLIQREREVYALRLGRERMMAWLQAFHRLSEEARPEAVVSMCAEWTAVMIEELHFQTAAAYQHDVSNGELSLIHGRSHSPLNDRVALNDGSRRTLRECGDGVFNGEVVGQSPDVAGLAHCLHLASFLWYVFPGEKGQQVLLVAGVAAGIAGAQGTISPDDPVYFTMLGRHLAVLLSNAALIGALGSATRNLQELFDHMRQAIVAFDATGAVGSISSRQAKTLFQRDDLQGCAVRDLLYRHAPSYDVDAASFGEWLEMAFATPAEEWASCEPYAPREVTLVRPSGESILLELEFRPLVRGSTITQLMLLATDVSLARKLERAVQTHEVEHARRLTAMRSLIAGGTQAFLGFVESVRSRLDRCDAVLREYPTVLPTGAIDELFRQAHTIRGEARAFDLIELEAATRKLEEDLDELRRTAHGRGHVLTESVLARLQSGLALARKALDDGCEVLVAASPAGSAVFDQITVQRSALRTLVEYVGDRSDKLGSLVSRLASVPFGVVAASVVEAVPSWAESEGTSVALKVDPRELMVPEALARVLPGVLTHLVRNAIAHGIEAPAERTAAGKPERGTIRIVADQVAAGIRVTVEDDGQGLNVEGIVGAAPPAEGFPATERVFLPGVSTRQSPDALAGRGVGLDAVRSELARVRYDASLAFSPGRWTRVTIAPRLVSATPDLPSPEVPVP